jgi:hypothetical protein
MAKIIEEKVVVMLSKLVPSKESEDLPAILDADQLDTLKQAVEGLIDDPTIVVEVVV